MIIYPTSLSATIESASECFLHQQPLNNLQSEEITSLLVGRQVLSGKNAAFFLPFTSEKETQPRLFTGEPLRTDFAYRHIQMIEATRLIVLLGIENVAVQHSISRSEQCMDASCYSKFCAKGECKAISIAYMRYLACFAHKDPDSKLPHFLTHLGSSRDGKGRWRGFPFFYTLLMLTELDDAVASQEIEYAAPACEKWLDQLDTPDHFSIRRRHILSYVLSRN
jgi:hypothetical protein